MPAASDVPYRRTGEEKCLLPPVAVTARIEIWEPESENPFAGARSAEFPVEHGGDEAL